LLHLATTALGGLHQSPDELIELVIEAADDNREYRQSLNLRSRTESPQR
jgi:hypothetical protein